MSFLHAIPPDLYVTAELAKRPSAPADYLREKRAIQDLAARMAGEPAEVLARLVALAMELTGTVSAGLSLLEAFPAPGVFRWRYLSGSLSSFEHTTTPRDYSPCGVTLDANSPILVRHPERFYGWVADANVVLPEVLLVPLYLGDIQPMGTLWVVAEREGYLNAEHARIAAELASFAGIAVKMLRSEEQLQSALQEQEMLTKEMSHRVKNLFAVADAMVAMARKTAASTDDMAEILRGRLHALASAQSLIRRSFGAHGMAPEVFDFADLLAAVLRPHERGAAGCAPRFLIAGPPLRCGEHALNAMALVFQELATNALKHGALGAEEGSVEIQWVQNGTSVTFCWQEQNGPAISGPPPVSGFGSKLLRDTVEKQMRGTIAHSWKEHGLAVHFDIPLEAFSR